MDKDRTGSAHNRIEPKGVSETRFLEKENEWRSPGRSSGRFSCICFTGVRAGDDVGFGLEMMNPVGSLCKHVS
ncbi:MAG: hypothetical protein CSA26_06475 [Desulfobacterales bacterium]|nr:MAG: hypothetical protein CSA26_06475 [Desulfobacterales bacterium]